MKTFPKKRPSDDEAIEAQAAAWLAQRDGGMTDADRVAFTAWRAADSRHAAAIARLDAVWSALSQLHNYRPSASAHPDRNLLAPRRAVAFFVFRPWIAGASVAAALIAVAFFLQRPEHPFSPVRSPTATYTTTAGGYQRVVLSDASIVELNDRSEVRVHFTAGRRRVQLVSGQAHFTVAKNPERPFIVETREVAIHAVGTAFDVRLGLNEVEVLVTEGIVQLSRASTPALHQPATAITDDPPRLGAGWRAVIPHEHDQALSLEMLPPDRIRETLSWQGPRLVFVETPLSEVIAQFNRRNHLQLSLGDAELASLPVGGSFRAENVESFVRLLSSNGDIAVERVGSDRIVLRQAP